MRRLLGFLFFFLLGYLASGGAAEAQEAAAPERFGDIPKDSVGVFSLEFAKMRTSKDFELWPWEVLDVAAKEQMGIDLASIESIDGMILMPSPEPEFGISIRTKQPYDIAQLPEQMLTPIAKSPKDDGMRFRDFAENPMIRVMQREANRVLVGTPGALRRMTSSRLQPGGDFVGLVQSSPAMLKLAVNLETLRDLIAAFAFSDENQIPAELVDDIETIIDLSDNVLVEFLPNSFSAMELSVGTSGADKTELLNKSLLRLRKEFIGYFSDSMMEEMKNDASVSDQMKKAIETYVTRMRKVIDNESLWEIRDDRLVMKVDKSMMSNYQVIGAMAGLLLPAVQSAREAARRMEGSNNLKQIMLALHNYESAYKKFPPRAIVDADKKPLLSWRVSILPFLEQQQLYDEFHLDEPWDSEHNIKLLDRMPKFYRNPSNPAAPGITTYLTFEGEGVGLSSDGLRIARITDGTSNTLALIDADPELGVPWTKPDDFDINLLDETDLLRPEGSFGAFFDGSVQFLSPLIDLETFKALMTHSGGEIVPMVP